MSEEKKLTDEEELVAKLETMLLPKFESIEYWDMPKKDVQVYYNLIQRQKAEIERLTEELESKKKECREIADDYQEMGTFYYNETVKNAELQKQVDELKEERENMQAEIMRFEDMKFTQEYCDLYKENEWLKASLQQSVKDTAKEILQTIKHAKENGQIFYNEAFMITAQKAYGVEVE